MGRPKIYDDTLRDRLLEEATRMLKDEGYQAVSLRTLTKNAGTSTNAVYTLFGSKEALISEVIVRDLDRKMALSSERGEHSCPLAQLMYLAGYYRWRALLDPKTFRGIFAANKDIRRGSTVLGRIHPDMQNLEVRVLGRFRDAAKLLGQDCELPDEQASELGACFWAAVHGLITLELEGMLEQNVADVPALYQQTVYGIYLGWCTGKIDQLPDRAKEAFEEGARDAEWLESSLEEERHPIASTAKGNA